MRDVVGIAGGVVVVDWVVRDGNEVVVGSADEGVMVRSESKDACNSSEIMVTVINN